MALTDKRTVVRSAGLEPATTELRCSIHLSYERVGRKHDRATRASPRINLG